MISQLLMQTQSIQDMISCKACRQHAKKKRPHTNSYRSNETLSWTRKKTWVLKKRERKTKTTKRDHPSYACFWLSCEYGQVTIRLTVRGEQKYELGDQNRSVGRTRGMAAVSERFCRGFARSFSSSARLSANPFTLPLPLPL